MLEILGKPEINMLDVTEQHQNIKFPVARKGINNDDIALFWGRRKGVIISVDEKYNRTIVGYVSDGWAPCDDPKIWQPVDIKITG